MRFHANEKVRGKEIEIYQDSAAFVESVGPMECHRGPVRRFDEIPCRVPGFSYPLL